jgi:soluble lytic murein transglycosylase-like protein
MTYRTQLGLLILTGWLMPLTASEPKPVQRLSPNAQAQTAPAAKTKPQILVYKSQREDGSAMFSDRPPADQQYELLRFDCYACAVTSPIDWHTTPLFQRRFARLIEQVASELILDPALIRAVIHAESAFNPQAVSRRGAQGLMQLMPQTAIMLGVADPISAVVAVIYNNLLAILMAIYAWP